MVLKELSQRFAKQWKACSEDERQVFYNYYNYVERPNHLQSKIDSKDNVGDSNSNTKAKRQQPMQKNLKNDDDNLNKRKRKQNESKQLVRTTTSFSNVRPKITKLSNYLFFAFPVIKLGFLIHEQARFRRRVTACHYKSPTLLFRQGAERTD